MMAGLIADLPDIDLQCARLKSDQRREPMAFQFGLERGQGCDGWGKTHQIKVPRNSFQCNSVYFFARHTSGFFPCIISIMPVNSMRAGVTSIKPKSGA